MEGPILGVLKGHLKYGWDNSRSYIVADDYLTSKVSYIVCTVQRPQSSTYKKSCIGLKLKEVDQHTLGYLVF